MSFTFHYPARCTGRPIDPFNLFDSDRGLTGSEIACFRLAIELGKLGHHVKVLGKFTMSGFAHGIDFVVEGTVDPFELVAADSAVLGWMVPDILKCAPISTFRVYDQQCTDFAMCEPGWEQHVDKIAALSEWHLRHLQDELHHRVPACVIPNGVDLDEHRPSEKQPGKVLWASSHDRGLHHLLELWPELKKRHPHATLDVCYDPSGLHAFSERPPTGVGWVDELQRRSAYSLEALERLAPLGVTMRGSVSRKQLAELMGRAEVLAYPCDPVRATESFGSTVLEVQAAGCLPVLCFSDAFGELWGECPGTFPPYAKEPYLEVLTAVLRQDERRKRDQAEARERARKYEWGVLGKRLELFLESRGARGF